MVSILSILFIHVGLRRQSTQAAGETPTRPGPLDQA